MKTAADRISWWSPLVGIGSRFPVKSRSYPEIPWKFINFSDHKFSSSSSRRVFCFRPRSLSKTVTIKQLSRKILPEYDRAYQGRWIPISWMNRIRVLLNLATRSFHIFPVYRKEKVKKLSLLPNIPSKEVANPASRKALLGPLIDYPRLWINYADYDNLLLWLMLVLTSNLSMSVRKSTLVLKSNLFEDVSEKQLIT